jgi:hypothetical protein
VIIPWLLAAALRRQDVGRDEAEKSLRDSALEHER